MLTNLRRRYIGDKAFYLTTVAVVLPIIIQNGITNFVGLLDNLMVGQVGTNPMSGVSIVNQLMFVYNLCIFGGISGPGILRPSTTAAATSRVSAIPSVLSSSFLR